MSELSEGADYGGGESVASAAADRAQAAEAAQHGAAARAALMAALPLQQAIGMRTLRSVTSHRK